MAFDCLKIYAFKKGVSLTELLVGMAIASGVSLGIVSIYMAHYRIFTNQNALVEAETQNKLAVDQILKYVHQGARFSFYSNICGTQDETITLGIALLPLDQNGNPFESGGNDHILFYRDITDPTKLVRTGYTKTNSTRSEAQNNPDLCIPPPDGKVVATGVTDFQIEYKDPPPCPCPPGLPDNYVNSKRADITLTTESKTIYGKTFTSTQTFTAYFRND